MESADARLLGLAGDVLAESFDGIADLAFDLLNDGVASASLLELEDDGDLVEELNEGQIDVDLDVLLAFSEALDNEGAGSVEDAREVVGVRLDDGRNNASGSLANLKRAKMNELKDIIGRRRENGPSRRDRRHRNSRTPRRQSRRRPRAPWRPRRQSRQHSWDRAP